MNVLISIGAFLLAVSILVTAHEFGHFIVARLMGVKVLRFSVGFGKPLLRRQKGDGTEYVLAALPFGGYVKMLDEREGNVPEQERHRAFNCQPIWQRAAILLAGPGFNLLFALLVYWIVFMIGVPGTKPVIGPVAPNTPAAVAGVNKKATIVAVNGEQTPTWQVARLALLDAVMLGEPVTLKVKAPDGSIHKRVLHYDNIAKLTRPGHLLSGLGLVPWTPPIKPVIGTVEPNSAAAQAGLFEGDRIVAVNGEPIKHWQELVKLIQANPYERVTIKVEREGEMHTVMAVLGAKKVGDKTIGLLGVFPRIPEGYGKALSARYRLGPASAFIQGSARTGMITSMTAVMLYRMASGQASLSNLSGPIGIAHSAGVLVQAGVVPYLLFLALISISLAVLNLLPIPILDGGQLLYLGIEAVQRRPLSERAEAIGQRVGLSLLAILIGFAVFNDLSRLFQP